MLIDMHIHTNISEDSNIKIGLLLRRLNQLGIEGVAITDHDSIEGVKKAREIAEKYNVTIFSGVEISTKQGHLLAYGITQKPPYKEDLQKTIDWVKKRGGITVPAHPFRITSPSIGEKIYDYSLDAIEINGQCLPM